MAAASPTRARGRRAEPAAAVVAEPSTPPSRCPRRRGPTGRARPAAVIATPTLSRSPRSRRPAPPAPVVVPAPEPVAAPPEPVVEPAAAVDDGARDAAARLAALGTAAVIADAATSEPAAGGPDARRQDGEPDDRAAQALPAGPEPRRRDRLVRAHAGSRPSRRPRPSSQPRRSRPPRSRPRPPRPPPSPSPQPRRPNRSSASRIPWSRSRRRPTEPVPPTADVVSQPTWQMVAPIRPPTAPSGEPSAMPAAASAVNPSGEPQWPDRPQWLGGGAASRPAVPQPTGDAAGRRSRPCGQNRTREVADPTGPAKPAGGTQPCVSCGLSLSATARFCRRCGTPQAG